MLSVAPWYLNAERDEEEGKRHARLQFQVLFSFHCQPSLEQLVNPSWVGCHIYSYYLGVSIHVPSREPERNCLVHYLIIMKRERGFKIEQKSQRSLTQKFPFQKVPPAPPQRGASRGTASETREFKENVKRQVVIHAHVTL